MQLVDLPIGSLTPAQWNANVMTLEMKAHLRRSIRRFGVVVPLVVRRTGDRYETIGGAQRLAVLQELGFTPVPCVIVQADDAEARLLSQALNRIAGQDDLALRAQLLQEVLTHLCQEEVLALLPESAESLKALVSLGQEDMADYLPAWQQAQAARLKHLQFQLIPAQLGIVEAALAKVMPKAKDAKGDSPNVRGTALFLLCKAYLNFTRGV